ncbi:hypothetical protein [Nocardia pseudobrasiliensis]|uniref:Uncharacterized protein n=1 Tax=Nocardia pseudobrasiliensis TaxID=45979 RepID=A0A370HYH7_9NOCA|nr:hypothetical protein [Nocardia pseudobrasiliensis]RDI63380.1 hypothetical protein DFR76_11077 [Nocardia pseudobrasiliensis]
MNNAETAASDTSAEPASAPAAQPDVMFTLGGLGGAVTTEPNSPQPGVAYEQPVAADGQSAVAGGQRAAADERPTVPDGQRVADAAPDAAAGGQSAVAGGERDAAARRAEFLDEPPADIPGYARNLARAIIDVVLPEAPPGWQRVDVVFSVTVPVIAAAAVFTDDFDATTQIGVPQQAGELVQLLREVTVPLTGRAWWRVLLHYTESDGVEIEYDYGEVPFAGDELLPPEAYRADLESYPQDRLPVWLAAYIRHGDRQSRTPAQAVIQSRADRDRGVMATRVGLPDPRLMWARWATVAAAAVAVRSDGGPRILGATGLFEATNGSGSTLHLLPGGRAVLSGGVWDAPALDTAYQQGSELPNYYAGAPEWLANPVLSHRAATGLLSFCYWWDGSGWYRGESPEPREIGAAIPGLWTSDTVIDIVCDVLGATASRPAIAELVAAAETYAVAADAVLRAFDVEGRTDLAGAMYQLALAGLTTEMIERP